MGLTAKEIGVVSKVTLGQEGRDRVCYAKGVKARKDGREGCEREFEARESRGSLLGYF